MAENAVPVEFWYDFASSYSYPAAMRIERLAEAAGVGLVFAGRIASFVRRTPRATRIIDWVFAGVIGGFALKLALSGSR